MKRNRLTPVALDPRHGLKGSHRTYRIRSSFECSLRTFVLRPTRGIAGKSKPTSSKLEAHWAGMCDRTKPLHAETRRAFHDNPDVGPQSFGWRALPIGSALWQSAA